MGYLGKPPKNLKKFPPPHAIFEKVLFRLFSSGDFGDFDFGPETEISTLTEMINFQVF